MASTDFIPCWSDPPFQIVSIRPAVCRRMRACSPSGSLTGHIFTWNRLYQILNNYHKWCRFDRIDPDREAQMIDLFSKHILYEVIYHSSILGFRCGDFQKIAPQTRGIAPSCGSDVRLQCSIKLENHVFYLSNCASHYRIWLLAQAKHARSAIGDYVCTVCTLVSSLV